jgi:hypothetical protein
MGNFRSAVLGKSMSPLTAVADDRSGTAAAITFGVTTEGFGTSHTDHRPRLVFVSLNYQPLVPRAQNGDEDVANWIGGRTAPAIIDLVRQRRIKLVKSPLMCVHETCGQSCISVCFWNATGKSVLCNLTMW